MRNILDKWYVSVFIIPIILTYLTNYIELPIIFENWEYSIITSLSILTGILIYEINNLTNQLKTIEEKPKKTDKKIIRELLDILNVDKFQEEIVQQDAWYGYYRDDIYRIIDFKEKAQLIGYKTSNEKLNTLINNFVSKLEDFTDFSSKRVYGKGDWLVPFKDNPDINPHEKVKEGTDRMNELTKTSFIELEILMNYLKEKDYI